MSTPDPAQQDESARPRVALIAGPTASGKSAIALALAEATDGVVVNADASQVYRDLAVLSARPDASDMARAPHRLFGHIDGAQACSAARWADEAKTEIAQAHRAGRLPILVGGTGLYIRTLLDGIAPIPDIDPAIRAEVRAMPVADAHTALLGEDPESAHRLAPADSARVARALEVVRSTGRSILWWRQQKAGGIGDSIDLRPVVLLPPRDWLTERCDQRFALMMERGAIEEVEALLARTLSPELPVMRAIGVPELSGWLNGDWSREDAIARATLATRQYAKRQYTWFSRQLPAEWPQVHEPIDNKKSIENVIKLLI
ncbi:tRNA (adenosine(37)-N6)-dimethylallyltransferase MiaA [Sphingobium subterraneum]|uniref:tRNA dimethylallyltransferase n=1 Tax=Sphingobium subterraneum TaxID=627688 RepID=A0A841J2B5_9SPHN|nr:tRNA (adenosine(37)-N6)-dimethylallyltransferase MiaA [Sphingobium subterraneum]MBB6124810.1 tRNA dimethylallyltransferase [Sphingobium subterraneum]